MVVGIDRCEDGKKSLGGSSAHDNRQLIQSGCGCALGGDLPGIRFEPHGGACGRTGGRQHLAKLQPVPQQRREMSG